ncbi:MAG: helix-turn-helix domain-containing protein [Clostridia bacterium]|nr:helix-turn-helix domain-containing protein [Clostridia bacterium]MDD3862478.1 helix-turn-helix domain-containing protein [Clostridia bacterium]MDD4408613.1 helix-turn-helix domain-containing protein [Clostridia bacterium]
MEDLKKVVANNIIKYRKRAKLTQVELAEKLNYSDKAISKWERGDSLPDIAVLNDIAKLFNVTLDSLVSDKEEKAVSGLRNFFQRFYSNKMLITMSSSFIAWLVASIIFVALSLFTGIPNLWMIFVYTFPINCIILIVYNYLWKNIYYNFITVSLLIISLAVCTYLTLYLFFEINRIWLIFIIIVPLLILAYLWFIARNKYK